MTSRVALTYPVDGLVSFHYFPGENDMRPLVDTGRFRLIGDSGAFSAHTSGVPIELGTYAEWVTRWREHLLWVAGLDVIGDQEATWRNWLKLRDRYGIESVPTVHAGTDPAALDRYVAEGASLVGLGGMAGRGQAVKAWPWAVEMFRRARRRHPGVRYHLWGVTSRRYLDQLPAWSADSSGTLSRVVRFASLRLFDPVDGRDHNIALTRRNVYAHGHLLRRTYGVDPADIERSHAGNRDVLIPLMAAVTQQYAGWLQRRHQVTPPALLAGHPGHGPRVHLVSTVDDLLVAVGCEPISRKRGTTQS